MYDSAIEEVYRAIEVSASYLPAHIQMAELLTLQKKLPQAAEKLKVIGHTFQVRGDTEGAIGAFTKATRVLPQDLDLRQSLIELLGRENRQAEIATQYVGMGYACYRMARLEDARRYYIEGLKISQQTQVEPELKTNLLSHLGDLEMQRLDWKRALPVWLELSRMQPENSHAAKNIVKSLLNLNEVSKGLKQLDQLLVKLIQAKKGREVLQMLEDLVADRPNEPGLVDRLSRLYVRTNQKPKAIALLDRLGESLLDQGKHKSAAKVIQKILSLDPPDPDGYRQLLTQINSL